ncbi:MAG: CBS domain-containing protein [Casimicrobiaceae bacterium]
MIDHIDVLLDEALRETFPASDPIAISIDAGKAANVSGTSRSVQSIAAGNAMDAAAAAITPAIQTTIYDNGVILVERLLPAARKRLVSVAEDAPLLAAARLLRTGIDLVVACSSGGILTGVVTKTDVVRQVSDSEGGSCVIAASFVMTHNVVSCRLAERVQDVWARMKERGLKNVPITDDEGRPIGVLNARDMLQVLLQEVQQEELLLRDYVMGVGYR